MIRRPPRSTLYPNTPLFRSGSGTFDAIAAHRAFGDALLEPERFPFDAFVSKTITLEPRQGNPPPRLWESPAGMINSDRKSTRLNSSHANISYAVFSLKTK